MTGTELDLLERAHALFSGAPAPIPAVAPAPQPPWVGGPVWYRSAVRAQRRVTAATEEVDGAAFAVLGSARADHAATRAATGGIVEQARADRHAAADGSLAHREMLRRRVARLRAQRAHVLTARRRARRDRAALQRLRYPHTVRRHRTSSAASASPAGAAVRAAMSRLGYPYVWGGDGPTRFDCSGLTQWSYEQAGIHLDRTTYQQIHQGVAVPAGRIRPGDLVFPSADHVQLAIGHNLVVEAPHPGAVVRISRLGGHVAIQRPVP